MIEPNDWQDGFLFLGNQLSLDFLNTQPVVNGAETEFLAGPQEFIRWLVAAGLLDRTKSAHLTREWAKDTSLKELLAFRESWRHVVLKLEQGEAPGSAVVRRLNELLYRHPSMEQVARSDNGWIREIRFEPKCPEDAFAPLAASAARLLTETDWTKIRKCPNCVLHFYDVSKKGTRRWCSMNMCGNRAKVAAYAARKKSTGRAG